MVDPSLRLPDWLDGGETICKLHASPRLYTGVPGPRGGNVAGLSELYPILARMALDSETACRFLKPPVRRDRRTYPASTC